MDFTSFAQLLAEELGVEHAENTSPHTSLYDDWMLDSLQAFQVFIIAEALAEISEPPSSLPSLYTVGDVFDHYSALVVSGPT